MDNVLNILQGILEAIGDFFKGLLGGITDIFSATDSTELIYTAIARWVFIFLAVFVLLKSILSLLRSKKSFGSVGISAFEYRGKPADHPLGKCDWQIEEL